jgi:hypothetical protein
MLSRAEVLDSAHPSVQGGAISRIKPNMGPAAGVPETFLFARVDFAKSAILMASDVPRVSLMFWLVS